MSMNHSMTTLAETSNMVSMSERGPWNAHNRTIMLDHTNTHTVPKMLTLDKELCPPNNSANCPSSFFSDIDSYLCPSHSPAQSSKNLNNSDNHQYGGGSFSQILFGNYVIYLGLSWVSHTVVQSNDIFIEQHLVSCFQMLYLW